jgi:putative flippase GtrA
MDKLIEKFKNTFFTAEFIKFVIIGIINTFNGVIFAYIYSELLNKNLAFVFGYISGLIISYLLNSFITFKEQLDIKKFIKFCISYIPNFIIQNIVVIVVYNILGLYELIAYALAALIGVPVTFLLMKFFAFKKHKLDN